MPVQPGGTSGALLMSTVGCVTIVTHTGGSMEGSRGLQNGVCLMSK